MIIKEQLNCLRLFADRVGFVVIIASIKCNDCLMWQYQYKDSFCYSNAFRVANTTSFISMKFSFLIYDNLNKTINK